MFGRPGASRKIAGGVDDRNVRQRLREIADQVSATAIIFLGQQPDVVAQREQSLEQRNRVRLSAGKRKRIGEPKRTRQKGAFLRRQSVDAIRGQITHHESVDEELALDRGDRALNPLIA
jgi:hypothetical protein